MRATVVACFCARFRAGYYALIDEMLCLITRRQSLRVCRCRRDTPSYAVFDILMRFTSRLEARQALRRPQFISCRSARCRRRYTPPRQITLDYASHADDYEIDATEMPLSAFVILSRRVHFPLAAFASPSFMVVDSSLVFLRHCWLFTAIFFAGFLTMI